MRTVELFDELAQRIRRLDSDVRLVAIDGCGGAGKTTFAGRPRSLSGASIVATDHFASWDNPTDWWPRMLEEVIDPLAEGRSARYRWYDWDRRTLGDWREVLPQPVVIIEGVSSSRSEWADRLAFAVWVEAPPDLRLKRGLERDGAEAQDAWVTWMAAEDSYVARDDPLSRVDIVVDGAPTLDHDPEREFVRID
ncbi:MAG: hypothetical protein WD598_06515 [Acidimicrobiia bacterium]